MTPQTVLRLLLCMCMLSLPAGYSQEFEKKLPLVFREDFESGADHWQPLDAKQWTIKKTDHGHVFSQFEKKST